MEPKLIISKEAARLLETGFKSNGCGSGFVSQIACSILMLPLGKDVVEGLKKCWIVHDAEYTISTRLKSTYHKDSSDVSLIENMRGVLVRCNKQYGYHERFVRYVHTGLLWGGDNAYWQKKANHSWNLVPNSTVTVALFGVAKLFGWL